MAPAEQQKWLQNVLYGIMTGIKVHDEAIYSQELKITHYGTIL